MKHPVLSALAGLLLFFWFVGVLANLIVLTVGIDEGGDERGLGLWLKERGALRPVFTIAIALLWPLFWGVMLLFFL